MATNDEPQSATKLFQCSQCPKSFSRGERLKEHILFKHTDDEFKSSYPCGKCLENSQPPKSFATKRYLNEHIRRAHGPHSFKCQFCFRTFHRPSSFRRHQLTHSKQNIVGERVGHKCSLCLKICICKADLQKHMFYVHKKKIEGATYFKCDICASEFVSRSYLERHVVGKHVVDKSFECPVCSKTFIDQDTLDKHIPMHDNKIKHFCDLCSTGFKRKVSLVRHLGVEHLKFFYCNKCSRSFENKSEFDQHSDPPKTDLSSELKLEFKCQICSESFYSQCFLDAHTNCHLKEIISPNTDEIKNPTDSKTNTNPPKPELMEKLNLEFQCELCSKVFDRESYLQAHRNLVHPNAVWTCSFAKCTKTFQFHNRLRRHKLTHVDDSGRKPFVCGVCQKSFHAPDYLELHEKTHPQDIQYKCISCNNSFVSDLAVFICSSKNCAFETVSEKEMAIHYSEQHGLPKVVLSANRISPKMKNNKVVMVKSASTSFCSRNASSEINDAGNKNNSNSLQV